ncbi:unnamed protein product [Mytilus edulis]|uniref:Uncharacterized protein n=1 Tax=Mytilus edulis TaxID=6550 RepID=A0A8S3T412_MYTED|nr:unnamed protein product [Mytilus edulis]
MHVVFTSVYGILSLHYSVASRTETKALSQNGWYHDAEGFKGYETKSENSLDKRQGDVLHKEVRPADLKSCPAGMRDDGISCWKDTYGRGVGRVPSKRSCESNQRDDGTSCWLDSYGRGTGRIPTKQSCPSGQRDDGTSCWNDAHIYGKGCCCTLFGCCHNCRSGYHDDGCTCRKTNVGITHSLFDRQYCHDDEDMYGRLCYPKCAADYHATGCCICTPRGGPRVIKTLAQRQYCNSNEERYGGLCYPKCKAGYHAVGCCLCEPTGGHCHNNEVKINGKCWGACKDGYADHDNGGVCTKTK